MRLRSAVPPVLGTVVGAGAALILLAVGVPRLFPVPPGLRASNVDFSVQRVPPRDFRLVTFLDQQRAWSNAGVSADSPVLKGFRYTVEPIRGNTLRYTIRWEPHGGGLLPPLPQPDTLLELYFAEVQPDGQNKPTEREGVRFSPPGPEYKVEVKLAAEARKVMQGQGYFTPAVAAFPVAEPVRLELTRGQEEVETVPLNREVTVLGRRFRLISVEFGRTTRVQLQQLDDPHTVGLYSIGFDVAGESADAGVKYKPERSFGGQPLTLLTQPEINWAAPKGTKVTLVVGHLLFYHPGQVRNVVYAFD